MMQRSRWLLCGSLFGAALLLAASSSTLRAQDFEGIITAKVKGMTGEMKLFVKGARSRMEITVPGQGAMAIIPDKAAGETYMVMPAQSMYLVVKMSDAERMVDSVVRTKTSDSATMTPTGRKEEIAGYPCEYYRLRDAKSATDVCLTSKLGVFRVGASMFGGAPGRGGPTDPPGWARELSRKGAFPLKIADTTGVMIWEVVTLEKKSLEAALFAPPKEYRRMEMPGGRPPQ